MTAAGDNLDRALHQERSELVLALNGNPVNADMAWQILHRWDALVEIARAAQRQAERDARVQELERERDDLGNALARERAKPGGSFDQWARLQAAEAALAEAESQRDDYKAAWEGRVRSGRDMALALADMRRALERTREALNLGNVAFAKEEVRLALAASEGTAPSEGEA